MRIGLCSLFKSSHGGGETLVAQLSSALIQSGYEVSNFYAFNKHPATQNNVGLSRAIFHLSHKPLLEDIFYDSEIVYHALRIHHFALHQKINLLHFHYANLIPSSFFLRKIDRIPIVITLHFCPLDYPPELANKLWHSPVFPVHQYLSFTMGVRNAAQVISPSKYYADLVERRCGVRPIVIPNSICLDNFAHFPPKKNARETLNFGPKDIVLLSVGRLSEEKGLVYLVKAFENIVRQYPLAKLVLAGDGPTKEVLTNLVDKLHLPNVLFVGRIPNRKYSLDLLLSAADIYVSSSVYESFGLSVLEALASGLPIVCTNVGGLPEIVENGVNGILVPPRNPDALSEAVLSLVSNELMCRRMRENNKKKAYLYSMDIIFPKILNLYNELL